MTLSLNAATGPARPAQSPKPAAADAQQTDSGDLFSDALSMVEQSAAQDASQAADGQTSEKPTEDAANADSHDTLPGMSQSVLSMMLTMPVVLSAPVQIAQAAPDIQSENGVTADVQSGALTGKSLVLGEMIEKASVEAGKLGAGKTSASGEMVEKALVETGKLDAGKTSAPGEMVEKALVETGKLDTGKVSASSEMVEKTLAETGKLDTGKESMPREKGDKTFAEANKLLDTVLHGIPNGAALLRAKGGNTFVQEASAAPRTERVDLAAADQTPGPVKAPTAVPVGEVQEAKQQTAFANAVPEAVATTAQAQTVDTSAPASQVSTVKLAAEPAQAGQQLLHALKDRIQFQVEKHSEHATIRLDPPMMGRIEITVRHEAGSLQVQMSATNAEVLRQLQSIGDNLRQDLVQRHYSDVSVSISDHAHDGSQQHQQEQEQEQAERERKQAGRALAEAGQEGAAFALASDND